MGILVRPGDLNKDTKNVIYSRIANKMPPVMMMMITAFGATNVPAATTKIKLKITEIKKDQKKQY